MKSAPKNAPTEALPQAHSQTGVLSLAALVHPRMLATSITLPLEILRAAAQAHRAHRRTKVQLTLLAETSGYLELADGLSLRTEQAEANFRPDILLIPAIWRNPRWVLTKHAWQLPLIKHYAELGSQICSVGSGSFLVAETGVLDGGSATTHWRWLDQFAETFPKVRLRRDQLITQHGQVFCVGSVNSIADLMVYFSGQLFSREVAVSIENQFSPEIRRRFTPHGLTGSNNEHTDEQILDAQLALRQQLQNPPTLTSLAQATGLTPRTLNRRFKAATGITPREYLNQARIEEAQSLLHHSNLPIAEVGWQVGFRDAGRFAAYFRQRIGVTPRDYRTAVRGKSFNASTTASM